MPTGDLSIEEQICNRYQAQLDQLDRIVYLLGQTEQEVLRIITPLDQEQRQLSRQIEVMNLQHEILEQAAKREVDLSQPEILGGFNRTYRERLITLQQNFIQDYQNFLQQRTHYFAQEQIFSLNDIQRSALSTQFQQRLAEEMLDYRAFELTVATYVLQTQRSLKAEIQDHFERYEALDRQKVQTIEAAYERRNFLGEKQQQLQQAQQDLLDNPHWHLLKACEQGELVQVEELVAAQRKSARNLFVDQVGAAGRTALHLACGNSHFTVVNYLLQQGANPLLADSAGYLPWHYAVVKSQSCTTTILEVLWQQLTAKAKNKECVDVMGPYGRTALHTATFFGNKTAVEWLLARGANINAAEQGAAQRTPLHNAAFKGYVTIVSILLKNGANPLATNANGESPLFEALFYGQEAVAQVFREQHLWLVPAQQAQLKEYLTDRPALRQCLIRLLQPEMELYTRAMTLESTYCSEHAGSSRAAQLGASLGNMWKTPITPSSDEPKSLTPTSSW
jgi:Ankyrin repeats (many copies)/Ankyrin repeats (3 copies)